MMTYRERHKLANEIIEQLKEKDLTMSEARKTIHIVREKLYQAECETKLSQFRGNL